MKEKPYGSIIVTMFMQIIYHIYKKKKKHSLRSYMEHVI